MNFSASDLRGQDGTPSEGLPLTVAEKSEFKSTSKSAEVVEFVQACVDAANHVKRFDWGETVEGRPLVGAIVSTRPYQPGDQDDRNVVLLLGNIHSGECAGKEALLKLLRELTENPAHPWLARNVILFAPNYNADGNDRIGKNNRRGQVGPENGMGRRENAQGLDLNRDFVKLDSPEARALVKLIDQVDPDIFVDCHTTNGSRHQYALTYDIPHNPTTAEPIRQYLRNQMMPEITSQLQDEGTLTFYYGNFNRDHTQWTTFGYEPRYSTEYVGLRGRLGILSEAYSYITYEERIEATHAFVSEILDYATANHAAIQQLLQMVDADLVRAAQQQPERVSISLGAKSEAFDQKFILKGFKDDQPHDYECEFIGNYVATETTPMPFAYLVPEKFSRVADRLRMHGVQLQQLDLDLTAQVEIDTFTELDRAERAFQKHKMVRADSERKTETRTIPAGTYVVSTAQPLGRLISYLLESSSDDGLVFWNFFDGEIEEGEEYPVMRMPHPGPLPTRPVTEIPRDRRIDLGMIDGPNRLLESNGSPPKWFGNTNWLSTQVWGRDVLMDAESAGLVDRPARPFDPGAIATALESEGLDKKLASDLANSDPDVATNGRYAIFANDDHAFVAFLEEDENDQPVVMRLGNPEAPGKLFDFNPQETRLAFVTDQGLHMLDLESREMGLVAAEHDKNLVGQLDWVYQEELYGRGNFKAFWWNPDGQRIAFLSLDETPVIPFTVMDHLPVRGKSEITNYPKAGDPLPTVKLGVVSSTDTDNVNWVELKQYESDEFLISRVTWSADGDVLLAQVQNRVQTWLDLVATDRNGNAPKVLFRDATEAWIESPGDPKFVSSNEFLWLSPRSGYNHLYRYNLDGEQLAQLTEGEWEVRSLLGVDPEKRYAYFTAAREQPLDLHAYRIRLDNGKLEQLTEGSGTHSVDFSEDFSFFLDRHSDVMRRTETSLYRNDGTWIRRLDAEVDDRYDYLKLSKPEFLQVKAADGHLMDAMLIRPTEFDPTRKYPVLVHIYAGPQAPRVRNRFGDTWFLWHQMLAQQGYVVWMCDNRSASYRNVKDAWPIHNKMAVNELADIESGIDWLSQQPWVDSNRIGIWGWSYGGYMTLYAMTHSKRFKMGISGAPVTDWKNYDAIYTERYMGLPQENEEGYRESSVLGKADRLHGELLLIHGTIDDNVHLNNTMQFVKELQDANKQFELMLYPANRHSVRDKKQAAHLRKLMTDFVLEKL